MTSVSVAYPIYLPGIDQHIIAERYEAIMNLTESGALQLKLPKDFRVTTQSTATNIESSTVPGLCLTA